MKPNIPFNRTRGDIGVVFSFCGPRWLKGRYVSGETLCIA